MHSSNDKFDGIYKLRMTNEKGHAPELNPYQQFHCMSLFLTQ